MLRRGQGRQESKEGCNEVQHDAGAKTPSTVLTNTQVAARTIYRGHLRFGNNRCSVFLCLGHVAHRSFRQASCNTEIQRGARWRKHKNTEHCFNQVLVAARTASSGRLRFRKNDSMPSLCLRHVAPRFPRPRGEATRCNEVQHELCAEIKSTEIYQTAGRHSNYIDRRPACW